MQQPTQRSDFAIRIRPTDAGAFEADLISDTGATFQVGAFSSTEAAQASSLRASSIAAEVVAALHRARVRSF